MSTLSVETAIETARAVAAQSGEELAPRDALIAAVTERLLVELEIAVAESTRYRQLLIQWNIPHKRAIARRAESRGFEIGWET